MSEIALSDLMAVYEHLTEVKSWMIYLTYKVDLSRIGKDTTRSPTGPTVQVCTAFTVSSMFCFTRNCYFTFKFFVLYLWDQIS